MEHTLCKVVNIHFPRFGGAPFSLVLLRNSVKPCQTACRRKRPYDIVFADQVSAVIPFIHAFTSSKVICPERRSWHFWEIHFELVGVMNSKASPACTLQAYSSWRLCYQPSKWPFNAVQEESYAIETDGCQDQYDSPLWERQDSVKVVTAEGRLKGVLCNSRYCFIATIRTCC